MIIVTSQLLLAICEFFLINWLGRHSISAGYRRISFVQSVEDSPLFDVVFRVLAPTVFLAITAALWYATNVESVLEHYWRVTVFYIAVRWAFNLVMGRARLIRWGKQILVGALAIGLSIVVWKQLLAHREAVLPSARALTDQLWIVVIGFMYLTARRVNWPALGASDVEKRENYVRARYSGFRRKFGEIVSETASSRAAEALSYAIMIYESFNRPLVLQLVENVVLYPIGIAHTLGPMQVSTPVRLPTRELVRLGVEHVNAVLSDELEKLTAELRSSTNKTQPGQNEIGSDGPRKNELEGERVRFEDLRSDFRLAAVSRAAAKYNVRSDYPTEVYGIFDILVNAFYPELRVQSRSSSSAPRALRK
jgi:hypothetical protein